MDYVLPFTFEDKPVRGKLINLNSSFKDIIKNKDYPAGVSKILAEFLVMSVYFGSSLKQKGSAAIQMQTSGDLKLLFVECHSSLNVRGIAKYELFEQSNIQNPVITEKDLESAKLALNIVIEDTDHTYQSLVPVTSTDVATLFTDYITQSEQTTTYLELFEDNGSIFGIFLQYLPENENDEDSSRTVESLKSLIKRNEDHSFSTQSGEDILRSFLPDEEIRVFKSSAVKMKCNCNRDKVKELLRVLGQSDAMKLVEERGEVRIDCEMCGNSQVFDKVDVVSLFEDKSNISSSKLKH